MNTDSSNSAQTPGANFMVPNSAKQKLDTVKLLEQGPNPAILYSIVDLGTHFNKNFNKSSRLIKLIFEFPLLKQLFNEGDTVARPTVVSQEYTFMLGESSNLKKLIDGMEGRVLQPNEYRNGWNLGQYLGRVFIVHIVNKPNKKDPSIIYNNVGSVQGLTDNLRKVYAFPWEEVTRTNPLVTFFIDPKGECFKTETFANLPKYYRETIMKSDEATAYASAGGVFAKYEDFKKAEDTPAPTQAQAATPQAAPPVQRKPQVGPIKRMLVTDFTYEQYIESKWTDELLVEHGKMEIIQPPVEEMSSLDQVDDNHFM